MEKSLSFSAASYNVLATAYLPYVRYRRTPAMVLDPAWRIPALVHQITDLETDVICLQEVELDTFAALKNRLSSLGYVAQYARKQAGQPDGCATFYREDNFELVATRLVAYADGVQGQAAASGHIALIVLLRVADRVVGIINTHLSWDPPGTVNSAKLSHRQAQQLLEAYRLMAPSCQGWLICGDLNATPDSDTVAILTGSGFQSAHFGLAHAYTCKVNSEAKIIDYLFHSPEFRAEPKTVAVISDQTALPSAEQPSDHLPVVARFFWKA
jgi:mRNA deadenylase 3'-5' endonuclease subunit Ccr4